MLSPQAYHFRFSRVIWYSVKLSVIFFIIGGVLANLPWILSFYPKPLLHPSWLNMLADVGQALIGFSWVLLIYLLIVSLLKEWQLKLEQQEKSILSYILSLLQRSLRVIFFFFALYAGLAAVEIKSKYLNTVNKIITIFIITAIAWLLIQLAGTIEVIFTRQSNNGSSLNYTKVHLIRNTIVCLITIVAIAASLMIFDPIRNIGISLLASAGFLTALLGLGAQKTFSSLMAGVQLAFTQPFQIGDTIAIEEEIGIIQEITFTHVIIKNLDQRKLIIPINYFLEKPFHNWSHHTKGLQNKIKLPITYSHSIDTVREEVEKILKASSAWDKKTALVTVAEIKEKAIELEIIVSAATLSQLSALSAEVREKLLKFMNPLPPALGSS